MYKIFIPKNSNLIYFQNPQFKLWDINKLNELIKIWEPYENDIFALEWTNFYVAKINLILKNNEFNDINFLIFKDIETDKNYCFWVNTIEFNSADKKNITITLVWDIFYDEIVTNISLSGYLEQTTLPEYTYYIKDSKIIYDKEGLNTSEGFTLPRPELKFLASLEAVRMYGNIYHFIKNKKATDVELPELTDNLTNIYLLNGPNRKILETTTFYMINNNTNKYNNLLASDNIIKTFTGILPKTPLLLSTHTYNWNDYNTYIERRGNDLADNYFKNQYSQRGRIGNYDLRGNEEKLRRTYFFDDSLYLDNGTERKVIKHRDAFLKACFFNDNEVYVFYKNLTCFKIDLNEIILKNGDFYLDDYKHLHKSLYVNGLAKSVWFSVFGVISENSETLGYNDYGYLNEDALTELPIFYEEEFNYNLNDNNYNLKVCVGGEHNKIIINSFYGQNELTNFTYFLNETNLNFFVGEVYTLGQTSVLTIRLFGDNNYINFDPATTSFYKTDKFLDYLFTNGSAFMTSKNYAEQNYKFTEEKNKLAKDMAITNIAKSVFGAVTGIASSTVSGASQGALLAGPAGAIGGGVTGALTGIVDGAFGIASSTIGYQQTELNNKIALANAQQSIDMINAQQQDLSRQSNVVFSNDKAKNSINYGFNQGGSSIQSATSVYLSVFKWEHTKKLKDTLNQHYKLYGWKNYKIINFDYNIKKSPKFDYIKINNCILKNIPKVYHDIILQTFNNGFWLINDETIENIFTLDFKENILSETTNI